MQVFSAGGTAQILRGNKQRNKLLFSIALLTEYNEVKIKKSCKFIISLLFLTKCAIMIYNAVSVVTSLGSMAI